MFKEKLKHLPINLFLSIPTPFMVYFFTITFTDVSYWVAACISFYIYLSDAIQSSTNDYLEERIEKIEKNLK